MSNGCDCSGSLKRVSTRLDVTGCLPFMWDPLVNPLTAVHWYPERYHAFSATVRRTYKSWSSEGSVLIEEDRDTGILTCGFSGDELGSIQVASAYHSSIYHSNGSKLYFTPEVPRYGGPSSVTDTYDYDFVIPANPPLEPNPIRYKGNGSRSVTPTSVSLDETFYEDGEPVGTTHVTATLSAAYSLADLHAEYRQLFQSGICDLSRIAYATALNTKTRSVYRLREAVHYGMNPNGGLAAKDWLVQAEHDAISAAIARGQYGNMPVFAAGVQFGSWHGYPDYYPAITFPSRATLSSWVNSSLSARHVWFDTDSDHQWADNPATMMAKQSALVAYEQTPWNGWVPYSRTAKYGIKSRVRESDLRHNRNYCLQSTTSGGYDTTQNPYVQTTRETFQLKGPQERDFIPAEIAPSSFGEPRLWEHIQYLRRDATAGATSCVDEPSAAC